MSLNYKLSAPTLKSNSRTTVPFIKRLVKDSFSSVITISVLCSFHKQGIKLDWWQVYVRDWFDKNHYKAMKKSRLIFLFSHALKVVWYTIFMLFLYKLYLEYLWTSVSSDTNQEDTYLVKHVNKKLFIQYICDAMIQTGCSLHW